MGSFTFLLGIKPRLQQCTLRNIQYKNKYNLFITRLRDGVTVQNAMQISFEMHEVKSEPILAQF
jgi:hypothetical protein